MYSMRLYKIFHESTSKPCSQWQNMGSGNVCNPTCVAICQWRTILIPKTKFLFLCFCIFTRNICKAQANRWQFSVSKHTS